jgi:hypothetical protein
MTERRARVACVLFRRDRVSSIRVTEQKSQFNAKWKLSLDGVGGEDTNHIFSMCDGTRE